METARLVVTLHRQVSKSSVESTQRRVLLHAPVELLSGGKKKAVRVGVSAIFLSQRERANGGFIELGAGGLLGCEEKDARGLGEQFGDGLGLHEFAWLVEMIINNRLGINTHAVVDGGEEFHRMHGIFHRS